MEHRHEQRLSCTLTILLYRNGVPVATAEVQNISNSGLCIRTTASLRHNEIVHIRFPEQAEQDNRPVDEHAVVAYAHGDLAGLLFERPVFKNMPTLQKICKDSDC